MPALGEESICWERGDSRLPAAVISSGPWEEEVGSPTRLHRREGD